MEKKIKELIEISRFYGVDKEYVIAGGGNTSFKNDEFLWIKASGVALSTIDKDGFVQMSREKLKVISEREYSKDSAQRESEVKRDMLKAIAIDNGMRPSVETSLHEIIKYPFVIHTHPTLVNALTCSKQAQEKSFKLLGNDILFVPYIDPGYVLFKNISDALKVYRKEKNKEPQIIVLENHGIFVSADSADEVKAIYADIENKIINASKKDLPSMISDSFMSDYIKVARDIFGADMEITTAKNELISWFVQDEDSFSEIRTAFTPDHIVYCKARYLFLSDGDDMASKVTAFYEKFGYMPKIIGVKGKGLIIVDDSASATDIIKELIQNMMKISYYAQAFGGSKPMTDEQIAFIENWEAENYRKKMAEKK